MVPPWTLRNNTICEIVKGGKLTESRVSTIKLIKYFFHVVEKASKVFRGPKAVLHYCEVDEGHRFYCLFWQAGRVQGA